MKLDILFDTRKKMSLSEQFAEGVKILVSERKLTYGYQFEAIQDIAEEFSLEEEIFVKGFERLEQQGFVKCMGGNYQLLPVMLTQDFYQKVTPLYQALIDAGYNYSIVTKEIKLTHKLPRMFNVTSEEKQGYLYVKRVYYANHMPMAVLEGYYPKKYFPKEYEHYKDTLFYQYYMDLGHQLKSSKRVINVVHPSDDINQLLYHPREVSSIQIISKLSNSRDDILEYSVSHASMNYTIYLKETLIK